MRPGFFKKYGFRIIFVIVFLLPFVWMGTKRTIMSNSNNVADWLPDNFVETKEYQWFLSNFPFERFVLISWKGCDLNDDRIEFFAQKLVPGQTIDNMDQWSSGGMLRAEVSAPSSLTNFPAEKTVEERMPTPSETTSDLSTPKNPTDPSPTRTAALSSDSPESPIPPPPSSPSLNDACKRYFKSVLTGPRLVHRLKSRYSSGPVTMSDAEIIEKLKGTLIGPDGKSTALIVTLTNEPQGKELSKVLETIREVGRECGVHPKKKVDERSLPVRMGSAVWNGILEMFQGRTPEMRGVILGGPPVDNVAITYEGEYTLFRLVGVCGLIGLILAYLCFRDIRLTLFVFWISILSAGVALAAVSFTGSTCDAIMLTMPALIYVLAMSGSVHIINYYHDAIHEGGLNAAPERALGFAWYPCFFANFTTALGLLSLYTSHLVPITKFGLYAAIGVMIQLTLLFYYLPALLHFYPSRNVTGLSEEEVVNSFMQRFWRVWGRFIIKHNKVVALVVFGSMVFFGYGLTQIKTSVKMMRFFSQDSEIIHHYTWLEGQIGPLVPMELVIKFDNKRCKFNTVERLRFVTQVSDRLRRKLAEDIGGVMSADTFLPSLELSTGRRGGRQMGYTSIVNSMVEKGRAELKEYVVVEGYPSLMADDPNYRKNLEEIGLTESQAERLVRAGFKSLKDVRNIAKGETRFGISLEEMDEFRDKTTRWEKEYGMDLWRISMRVWSLKRDIDYLTFLEKIKSEVNVMVEDANKKLFPGIVLEDPHATIDHDPKKVVQRLVSLVFGIDTSSEAVYRASTNPISVVYTGMVPVVYKTQKELLSGLRDSFVSSFVMIAIVMAFILKSPVSGFIAMIPNLFPVVTVFGFMGTFGILVDVGTMMTASVALGIAVDDTIHFLTWFRQGIVEGMSRKEATMFAYSRAATAMMQTSLIGGLGLSAFALSTFTPTQMFGIMMLAILLSAVFGDLVLMAALLNTPIGKVFMPRKKAKALVQEENLPGEAHRIDHPESLPPAPEAERRSTGHKPSQASNQR